MNIQYIPIDSICPCDRNAKTHPEWQINQIASSIKEFGFNDPIAVDKSGTIIEGHGRYLAAKQLGIKVVPVIYLNELTEQQRKAYALVHNQTTMNTGFDYDMLKQELDGLSVDMEQYGFDMEESEYSYQIDNREYSLEDFKDDKFRYECEECGFKFNA